MATTLKHLRALGKAVPVATVPEARILETFPNPGRAPYTIEFVTEEFTSLCPLTGQPDYMTVRISYIPDKLCLESKSLKLYLGAYRHVGSFIEALTHRIRADIAGVVNPAHLSVEMIMRPRGGIEMRVHAPLGPGA